VVTFPTLNISLEELLLELDCILSP
jgi:hypothetical protein